MGSRSCTAPALKAGRAPDVNLPTVHESEWGESPIILAAGKGHAAMVNALAEVGADVNFARAETSVAAVFVASQEGN